MERCSCPLQRQKGHCRSCDAIPCIMCGKTYAGCGSLRAHIWNSKLHTGASHDEKMYATMPACRVLRHVRIEHKTLDDRVAEATHYYLLAKAAADSAVMVNQSATD